MQPTNIIVEYFSINDVLTHEDFFEGATSIDHVIPIINTELTTDDGHAYAVLSVGHDYTLRISRE